VNSLHKTTHPSIFLPLPMSEKTAKPAPPKQPKVKKVAIMFVMPSPGPANGKPSHRTGKNHNERCSSPDSTQPRHEKCFRRLKVCGNSRCSPNIARPQASKPTTRTPIFDRCAQGNPDDFSRTPRDPQILARSTMSTQRTAFLARDQEFCWLDRDIEATQGGHAQA
jgi:hypothetical protein